VRRDLRKIGFQFRALCRTGSFVVLDRKPQLSLSVYPGMRPNSITERAPRQGKRGASFEGLTESLAARLASMCGLMRQFDESDRLATAKERVPATPGLKVNEMSSPGGHRRIPEYRRCQEGRCHWLRSMKSQLLPRSTLEKVESHEPRGSGCGRSAAAKLPVVTQTHHPSVLVQ
jgi:hypothetical protein